MNLTLIRTEAREDGIFSELRDEGGQLLFQTLEHAYDLKPKIPDGEFTCRRGLHKLHGMVDPFATFEITGVEGHENLLFHWGNFNRDSEGCVLLGKGLAVSDGAQMVTDSKKAFAEFMAMQEGVAEFQLTVK